MNLACYLSLNFVDDIDKTIPVHGAGTDDRYRGVRSPWHALELITVSFHPPQVGGPTSHEIVYDLSVASA